MDKRILSACCAALLLALSGLPLRAQSVLADHSSLSVQVGPACYTGRFLGLTHAGADYRGDLRRGVAWSVDYWWRGVRDRDWVIRLSMRMPFHPGPSSMERRSGSSCAPRAPARSAGACSRPWTHGCWYSRGIAPRSPGSRRRLPRASPHHPSGQISMQGRL